MDGACGDVKQARLVFDELLAGESQVSWNAMLTAYTQNGRSPEALQLFQHMDNEGVRKDRVTYISVFGSCEDIQATRELYTRAVNTGLISDLRVSTAAINMFGKCGGIVDAKLVFDGIQFKDEVCYCSFISACSQNGSFEQAVSSYRELTASSRALPDETNFASVLDACSGLKSLKDGKEVHERIICRKMEKDTVVLNALVNMYGKCGSLEDAVKVFQGSGEKKNSVTWNCLIDAHASCGLSSVALELFLQMKLDGFQPSEVTLVIVLSACSHAGLAGQGWQEFVNME